MQTERQKEYGKYLKSDWWLKRKQEIKEYWNGECVACGGNDRINIHHLNYDNLNNETLVDAVPLCRSCHFDVHKERLFIFVFNNEEMKHFKSIKHVIEKSGLNYVGINKDKLTSNGAI